VIAKGALYLRAIREGEMYQASNISINRVVAVLIPNVSEVFKFSGFLHFSERFIPAKGIKE